MPARTEFKRIVVLANSIKKHARCVAGVETGDDIGGWIRPVSGESEGELEPRHTRVNDGKALEVLDIVDVPLVRCLNDRVHPEDWVVDARQPWQRVSRLNPKNLRAFEEFPADLWLEPGAKNDRATGKFLRARHGHQSLYLVRPTHLRIELSCVHNEFKNVDQKKTRAKFSYESRKYEMGLTDPVFNDRYCKVFPAVGAKPSIISPEFGDHCLICVSLTPEFNGYHYKVVASILELQ